MDSQVGGASAFVTMGTPSVWRIAKTACQIALGVLLILLGLLLAATQAAAQSTNDVVLYYDVDAIGSVRMITDASGDVVARYDYLPFGQEWPSQGSLAVDTRRFTGKERDQETSLRKLPSSVHSS